MLAASNAPCSRKDRWRRRAADLLRACLLAVITILVYAITSEADLREDVDRLNGAAIKAGRSV